MSYAMEPPWGDWVRSKAGRRLAGRAWLAAQIAEEARRAHSGPDRLPDEERDDVRDRPYGPGPRGHGHGHGRRGPRPGAGGPGGWGGPGWAPWADLLGPGAQGWPFGPGRGSWRGPGGGPRGRGPRVRRGDVRAAVLSVLVDGPRNGYQLIQEIGERSGGAWRPSPGSVYPTLSQLEDEGLIAATEVEGRRAFALTDAGRDYARDHADELAAPWAAFAAAAAAAASAEDDLEDEPAWAGIRDLREKGVALAAAVVQVAQAGTPEQRAAAAAIVDEARRRIYRLLAEDQPQDPGDD